MRSNDNEKIIVVGIPKTLDDAQLSELFSDFGYVDEAKVVLDAASNTSRGFGFVTFTTFPAMRAAIKGMNRKVMKGRTLHVRKLLPKEKFQAKKTHDNSKRPCWLLRKGKCTKGVNCPLSHDVKDGEFGNCFEFVETGQCKHGDNCKFIHPQTTEDGEKQKRGKKCQYAHEMLVSGDQVDAEKRSKKETETGKKRRRMKESEDEEVAQMKAEKPKLTEKIETETQKLKKVKQNEESKKIECKAGAQTGREGESIVKQEQGRELDVEEPKRQLKKMKTEKIVVDAAMDGASDDKARSRKRKVDEEMMHANSEKLVQEKRKVKKTASSK